MTNAGLRWDLKDAAFLAANPTIILGLNEPIYINDGRYSYGDGTTPLSLLTFFPKVNQKINQSFTVASGVGSITTLTYTPSFLSYIQINGQLITDGLGFTIFGNQITWLNDYTGQSGVASYEYTGSSVLTPSLIGNFLDSSNVSKGNLWNASNYTDTGGIATFTGSSIIINGGVGDFSKTLEYNNWITDRENLTWTDTFTVNGITASTSGYGMQFHSRYNQFMTFALGMDNGGNNGTLFVFNYTGTIIQQISAAIPPVVNGDQLIFKHEIINATLIKLTVTNVTHPATASIQQQFNYNYPFSNILPVVSKFKRIAFGCNMTMTATSIAAVGEYTYPDAIFCGDSKIKGYFATGTTTANTAVGLLQAAKPTKRIYNLSGANETIQDMHDRLAEILSYGSDPLRKTIVPIIIGCNDVRNGTFNSTMKALQIADFNALKAANFDPYICYAIPENTLDITPYNTWANGEPTFTGKVITRTYTDIWSGSGTTPNASYISADGIHPNLAAQTIISNVFNTLI